jgi:2'-5' RNA ligase
VPDRALVLVLDEPRLASLRERFYPEAVARGLPLHLTVLHPFGGDVERAREVVAAHAPLRFALRRLGEFPGGFAVALPEPDEAIRALQRAVWDAFPEWPPYGGEVDDPEPHATLARGGLTDELRAAAQPLLPAACRVDAVTVLEALEPERWQEVQRLDLRLPRRALNGSLATGSTNA